MPHKRKEILPGVFLTCAQPMGSDGSFLRLHLLTQLDREHAAQNAAIPGVLRQGTVRWPDEDALAARLEALHDARLEPSVSKQGEIQCLGFEAKFGRDEDLEPMAELLGELLLAPNTRGGLLLPRYVDSEKQHLLEKVRDGQDDPLVRLIELMCPGEDYAAWPLGDEDAVDAIGYVPLTKHYKNLLAVSPIEIFYCGREAFDRVAAAMMDALATLPRGELDFELGTDMRMNTVDETVRVFGDEPEDGQGILAVGYRLGEAMEDPDIPALLVACALAAEGIDGPMEPPHTDLIKGVMTTCCTVDGTKYPEVLAALERRLQAVQAGDFTGQALDAAKDGVAGKDAWPLERLADFWLTQNLLGLEYGPEEFMALVEDVTPEDVVKAAAGMAIDGAYFAAADPKED